ncbi:perlucin-like [Mizuhopecten yessoensis]|uniref:perlucin-like n=1 Tax=Mizuhopecten yessoensis TaxID=6573 RepID=UPI000B45D663|nr:perlucin-like [Mizuhopecten yessoensis]
MAAPAQFCIFILLVKLVAVCAECPDGFTRHGTSCYTVPHVKADWSQATVVCKELGAHLVEFEDATEERFVHGFLSLHWRAYSPPEFWIAGNDILEEGHWQWASGKPVTFANWDDDQPDNGGDHDNNEHCMEVKQKDQWKWNDQECQEYRFFICEMPITDNIGGSQPGIIG